MRPSILPRLLATAVLLALVGSPARPASAEVAGGQLRRAVAVLHAWDERREAAWRATDPEALRALYVPGSRAGAADLRLLRAYVARGLVVRRIETQVFAVEVLRAEGRILRLRVLDRVAGGDLVDGGRSRSLGTTPPAMRTIALERTPGAGWRVREVSETG